LALNHLQRIGGVGFAVHLLAVSMLARNLVVPAPQYLEPLKYSFQVQAHSQVSMTSGPSRAASDAKMQIAAALLRGLFEASAVRVRTDRASPEPGRTCLALWDYSSDPKPPVRLNYLDRQILSDPQHYGQAYVLRVTNERTLWVIGSTSQGVLFGATTVLQLAQGVNGGVYIPGVYIRDYPDFEFRAAADWLLNVEIDG